jgi:hypothetical protein
MDGVREVTAPVKDGLGAIPVGELMGSFHPTHCRDERQPIVTATSNVMPFIDGRLELRVVR